MYVIMNPLLSPNCLVHLLNVSLLHGSGSPWKPGHVSLDGPLPRGSVLVGEGSPEAELTELPGAAGAQHKGSCLCTWRDGPLTSLTGIHHTRYQFFLQVRTVRLHPLGTFQIHSDHPQAAVTPA